MRSVTVCRYGAAADVLEVRDDTSTPEPAPDEILVQARATSVNPVDCTARNGYGRNIFATLWGELPLILGRLDELPHLVDQLHLVSRTLEGEVGGS